MTKDQAKCRANPDRRTVVGGLLLSALGSRAGIAAEGVAVQPPKQVRRWLRRTGQGPLALPFDYFGLHSDHGMGGKTPFPTYPYDAIRSHDTSDGKDMPVLQWAGIEVAPGQYDWRAMDAWIEANPRKTRIFVLSGCPAFYQKYPGEPWPYPYLPGGGSPPRDPDAAGRFIAAILRRYPGQIHFVEPWNEPNFG
ncbi:MAG: hypothetical protein ACK5JT_22585 [Hyphomicrobiaceae bacterium]